MTELQQILTVTLVGLFVAIAALVAMWLAVQVVVEIRNEWRRL